MIYLLLQAGYCRGPSTSTSSRREGPPRGAGGWGCLGCAEAPTLPQHYLHFCFWHALVGWPKD